jgi:hypothetical protein
MGEARKAGVYGGGAYESLVTQKTEDPMSPENSGAFGRRQKESNASKGENNINVYTARRCPMNVSMPSFDALVNKRKARWNHSVA